MSFTEESINQYLDSVAAQVEKRFPNFEYSLVPLGQAHFNFVWKGYRAGRDTQRSSEA
jgi:hypothetical protein